MVPTLRLAAVAILAGLLGAACALLPAGDERDPIPASPPNTPGGDASGKVTGSGNVISESRPVRDFVRVNISGVGELLIEQGDDESLSIEAEDNLLPLLAADVDDGQLRLGVRANSTIIATRPIIYRLKVRSLESLEASGTVSVEATGLDTAEMDIDISGSVSMVLQGVATVQQLTLSGTANFDGRQLRGRRATVSASGTGEAIVNATEALEVEVGGTALVRHLGNPRLTQQTSGLGRVEPL